MAEITRDDKLANKVEQALEICWNTTESNNSGPTAYSFPAHQFAEDGKNLFVGELKMLNVMLRDARNINLYGQYAATISKAGPTGEVVVVFVPVPDADDIVSMEL